MSLSPTINWRAELRDYLVITLGLLFYAVGFKCFIVPHEITCGGTTGLGAVILYATGGFWKVEYTFFLCNAILLCFAYYHLSLRYCVKTLYSVAMLTLLLYGVEWGLKALYAFRPELFPSGMNEHLHLPILLDNQFMSCIIGGAVQGIGMGWVFLRNGSTGGTDVVASIVNKYRDMSLGTLVLLSDVVIVSSSLFLPGSSLEKYLYGLTTLLVVMLMIDYVVNSGRESVQFFIFSDRYEEIASAINELNRGVTVLDGRGWYTKRERKVLVVLARKRETSTIFRIIQELDPHAFVSQSAVRGVFGFGFDQMRLQKENDQQRAKIAAKAKADHEASVKSGK